MLDIYKWAGIDLLLDSDFLHLAYCLSQAKQFYLKIVKIFEVILMIYDIGKHCPR